MQKFLLSLILLIVLVGALSAQVVVSGKVGEYVYITIGDDGFIVTPPTGITPKLPVRVFRGWPGQHIKITLSNALSGGGYRDSEYAEVTVVTDSMGRYTVTVADVHDSNPDYVFRTSIQLEVFHLETNEAYRCIPYTGNHVCDFIY